MVQNMSMDTLGMIKEDMDVLDKNGQKIGTVKSIHFGSEDFSKTGPETASAPEAGEQKTLMEEIAETLTPPFDIPEEVRKHMIRYGYIKIDRGLLRRDHCATLDTVTSLNDDEVLLNIAQDEAIEL